MCWQSFFEICISPCLLLLVVWIEKETKKTGEIINTYMLLFKIVVLEVINDIQVNYEYIMNQRFLDLVLQVCNNCKGYLYRFFFLSSNYYFVVFFAGFRIIYLIFSYIF